MFTLSFPYFLGSSCFNLAFHTFWGASVFCRFCTNSPLISLANVSYVGYESTRCHSALRLRIWSKLTCRTILILMHVHYGRTGHCGSLSLLSRGCLIEFFPCSVAAKRTLGVQFLVVTWYGCHSPTTSDAFLYAATAPKRP